MSLWKGKSQDERMLEIEDLSLDTIVGKDVVDHLSGEIKGKDEADHVSNSFGKVGTTLGENDLMNLAGAIEDDDKVDHVSKTEGTTLGYNDFMKLAGEIYSLAKYDMNDMVKNHRVTMREQYRSHNRLDHSHRW